MSKAIVPYKVQPPAALLPTTDELSIIAAIAGTATKGGSLLPKIGSGPNRRDMTVGEASVIMLYGRELGVQPMAALNQIYVVNNRPVPSAQLLLGLMQSRDPEAWCEIVERTAERARVRLHYKGRAQVFEATMADAQKAKLTGNPTWSTYPKQMLVWTAVRTGVRLMAPDAINALAQLPSFDQASEAVAEVQAYDVEATAVDVTDLEEAEPSLTEEDEEDVTAPPIASEPEAVPPPPADEEVDIPALRRRVMVALKELAPDAMLELVRAHAPDAVSPKDNILASELTQEQCEKMLADLEVAVAAQG